MELKSYFGCLVRQRQDENTTSFFVFHARVGDVRQWVGVKRSEEFPEGTQRVLRPSRKRAITRFLKAKPINTIPNNILVAFDPGRTEFTPLNKVKEDCFTGYYNGCEDQLTWGVLEFSFEPNQPEHLRPALVVDGQHRLYGMADFTDEDLPVLIVSLVEADIQEQAFQFIVINSKAVKVTAVNAKSIIEDVNEDLLRDRLLEAGVKYGEQSPLLREVNDFNSSPFQNLLDWDYNRTDTKLVPLTAIEQSLKHTRNLFEILDADEDSLLEIFLAIWRGVKAAYPELWGDEEGIFMKKVNLVAMNEFLIDRLKMAWEFGIIDIFEARKVEDTVLDILQKTSPELWQKEWSINIQDNANVRHMIKHDVEQMINNNRLGREWHDNLELPKLND